MVTKEYEIDACLVDALKVEIAAKKLPLQIQTGIPFTSGCGNQMMTIQIDCADDYADELGLLISRIINKTYDLT